VFVKPLLGGDEREVLDSLKRNVRFLRGEVARRVNTKYAADLKFLPDESFEEGGRIDAILRSPKVAQDLGEE
jgi:ribosome-binding factor A